jgi:catechol 2,3-dioxygenase-like lactoylglutathione lyase family enzyme
VTRIWTIIGVRDVARSLLWYQSLLGLPASRPHHDYFGQVLNDDGTVLLCLHAWGDHEHPTLLSPDAASPGNGLILYFPVDDFDEAIVRARGLAVPLEMAPRVNPDTGNREFALRDLDGYFVMISALA